MKAFGVRDTGGPRWGALPSLLTALALLAPGLASAGVRPAYGGELRILLPGVPRVPDPARAVDPSDLFLVRALHATPLEIDPAGRLAPGVLEEVPEPQAGGRAFRLRLRAGLHFADGTPIGAADLAASLSRLLVKNGPHAWVALPILGADALREGRAATLAGVQVLSDRELLVTLAFALPEWPWALAAPPAAVVSSRGVGAGPFALTAMEAGAVRLAANPHHHRGRPFADALVLAAADPRGAVRALERGDADLVLRPEAAGAGAMATPALLATVAAVNRRRLGAGAEQMRRALDGLDRTELARLFVRGPSSPLRTVVPDAILPGAPAAPGPGGEVGAPPGRAVLLALAGAPDQRAVADRLQVKLFDRGVRAAVEAEEPGRFEARLAAEDYDVALVPVPVLALSPALAAGQVALAARGPVAARRALAELAGLPPDEALSRTAQMARRLDLVPLLATGARVSAVGSLQGIAPRADGGLDPGGLWRLGRPAR